MLSVVACLWDANQNSHWFSQCYDETWVTKLYQGFTRNLTKPFRFVLFTEKRRKLPYDIVQEPLEGECSYHSMIQPFRMGVPMILVGLDTVIVGNIDHMADYCMTASSIALPSDPFNETTVCNGVALVPRGFDHVYENHRGENDMEYMRRQKYVRTDFLFPGEIVSYKAHVKPSGKLGNAKIIYFHGDEKPHQLMHLDWIQKHWNG